MLEIGRLPCFEINREDIEACRDIAVRQLPQVMAGEAAQGSALVGVDRGFGSGYRTRGARLDLNEAEGIFGGVGLRTR